MILDVGGMCPERLSRALSTITSPKNRRSEETKRKLSRSMREHHERKRSMRESSAELHNKIKRLREAYAKGKTISRMRDEFRFDSYKIHRICSGEMYFDLPGPISEKRIIKPRSART